MFSGKSLILLLTDQVPCFGGHVGAGGDLAEQRLQAHQDHDVRCDERGVALIDTNTITNTNRNIVTIYALQYQHLLSWIVKCHKLFGYFF